MVHKAPGKSRRTGISILELFKMFPTEDKSREWLESLRWKDGVFCPKCGSTRVSGGQSHATMTHRCKDCRGWFSIRYGTVMQSSKLGFQIWAIAIYLLTTNLKSVSSMKLHRDLNITQKTAWHLAHRLRKTFQSEQLCFSGPVEVDETYIGGKRKNMSNSKRKELADTGRGAVGKAAVVGIKDRATNNIKAHVVEATDKPTLQGFVVSNIDDGTKVYTDEARAYKGLDNHETVNHSVKEFVNGMAHTNGIESFWSMLKRGYYGTFHHFSDKHLQRYVDEFVTRHNIRELDTLAQMEFMVNKMEGKRLTYKELIDG